MACTCALLQHTCPECQRERETDTRPIRVEPKK